ncbi:hypothetical protein QRE66_04790 [Bacillus cereus]|nr:hypothetical protein QRE66_04790 [Bacillus cereus]
MGDKVLDITYYQLAKDAYITEEVDHRDVYKTGTKEVIQTWDVNKETSFHDKQTGLDVTVFEREVNGKTQVMVAFRGTEGSTAIKTVEIAGKQIPVGPGKTFNDLGTDGNHFIMREGVHDPAPPPSSGSTGSGTETIEPGKYWNEENK